MSCVVQYERVEDDDVDSRVLDSYTFLVLETHTQLPSAAD